MGSVSLYQVSKRFGTSINALDNISLDIKSGELVAVLGSSGCGKTTLLRTVAGLEKPTTGRILINGRDITLLPTHKRPIGMVFQNYTLFPNMTVWQNIAFPLKVRKWSQKAIDRRVEELLELVQLGDAIDRYPHQLSGGQQQRTALARALAPSPDVLLLDEPFASLDALIRQQLRTQIRQIQQTLQITTLFVTHDQAEAMAIADRIAVIRDGKIEQFASPLEIYEFPSTQFSASFIGSRNALELPIQDGKICYGNILTLSVSQISSKRAIVFFRPEDVELSNNGRGQVATILGKIFQGAFTRLHLSFQIEGKTGQFYADLPSRQAVNFKPNDTVMVSINPAHVTVFPAD